MSVEISASQEAQARHLAQKKNELLDEENAAVVARAQAERKRLEEGARIEEKNERALVEISKAGEQQLAAAKKLNTDRLHAIDENSKKAYEQLALNTAEELKRAEGRALDTIEAHRASSTERLKSLVDRAEDPFYRIKTLAPLLREEADAYTVQVSLPPHEAENLLVSSDGHAVNLALSRRYQDKVNNPEGSTRTNSFQSIVEQVAMPGPYVANKISRDYKDGVLTIRVPKAVMPGPHGELKS
jgi:HSP20 family molecular chaperone IbpA